MRKFFTWMFALIWCFILFVEVYDIYWTVKLQEALPENEKNPIGLFLIWLDGGDVALFIAVKTAAIIMLLAGIPLLFMLNRRKTAYFLLFATLLCKVCLLLFLETGHLWPSFGNFVVMALSFQGITHKFWYAI
jgi:cytochrome b subunit of formate dehydrogenase